MASINHPMHHNIKNIKDILTFLEKKRTWEAKLIKSWALVHCSKTNILKLKEMLFKLHMVLVLFNTHGIGAICYTWHWCKICPSCECGVHGWLPISMVQWWLWWLRIIEAKPFSRFSSYIYTIELAHLTSINVWSMVSRSHRLYVAVINDEFNEGPGLWCPPNGDLSLSGCYVTLVESLDRVHDFPVS